MINQTEREKWLAIGNILHHYPDTPIAGAVPVLKWSMATPARPWSVVCPVCERTSRYERGIAVDFCPACDTQIIILLADDLKMACELRRIAAKWRAVTEAIFEGRPRPRTGPLSDLDFDDDE
jgi:hypothetical protein